MRISINEKKRDTRQEFFLNNYGRLNGWFRACKLNLPIQRECYIIYDENDLVECISETKDMEMLYCRADSLWGKGNNLPRSKDIQAEGLSDFFDDSKELGFENILIVYKHPSVWLTGRYIPRYKTSGAAHIMFGTDKNITVEMVGPGFDCGELSRGKSVHFRIRIGKQSILFDTADILQNEINFGGRVYIDEDGYAFSRKKRIEELSAEVKTGELEDSIPTRCKKLNDIFEIVKEECILPIINQNELWNNHVLQINLYDNQPYVYEVWKPERSMKIY